MLFSRKKLLGDTERLGRWGEKRCEKFLKKLGYRKLTQNFSCRAGEIDLIMTDATGVLVFVEVKTRTGEDFTATEDVITTTKRNKLIKTARYFIASNKLEDRPLRFDVVTIVLGPTGREQIRHYENAFRP